MGITFEMEEARRFATLVTEKSRSLAVPIYGKAESLNLAAAAAVCLYASARAQRVHAVTGQDGM